MITKLQDSSLEKVAGGAETLEYPPLMPADVAARVIAGPAGDHSPVFGA